MDFNELSILTGRDKSRWSGAAFNCQGQKIIICNSTHADVRQESTIMHEIAHFICGHEPSVPTGLDIQLLNYNAEHEIEAEWLGGCLQLPREGLLWALKKGMTVEEIANHFKASLSMTQYRIGISGVKVQMERAQKFYKFK